MCLPRVQSARDVLLFAPLRRSFRLGPHWGQIRFMLRPPLALRPTDCARQRAREPLPCILLPIGESSKKHILIFTALFSIGRTLHELPPTTRVMRPSGWNARAPISSPSILHSPSPNFIKALHSRAGIATASRWRKGRSPLSPLASPAITKVESTAFLKSLSRYPLWRACSFNGVVASLDESSLACAITILLIG